MRTTWLLVTCIFFLVRPLQAQEEAFMQKAEQYRDQGEPDSAVFMLEKAVVQFKSQQNQTQLEQAIIMLATLRYDMAQYETALSELQAAGLKLPESQFRKQKLLGDVHYARNGQFRDAIEYYKKVIEHGDERSVAYAKEQIEELKK